MPRHRRRQLFEFNDAAWVPAVLRQTIVESLSRTLAWGRMLDGLVQPLTELLEQTHATEVLDLCAGAGRPAAILAAAMRANGRPPTRFLLSDLFPHLEEWEQLRREQPQDIDFVSEPLDATRIPAEVGRGRPRLIINALHHFPPEVAAQVLAGACRDAPGILVAEGLERNLLSLLPVAVWGLPALYANPLLATKDRWRKAALTWFSPVALAASVWDGSVSALRMYTEAELRELARAAGDGWRWDFGTFEFFPFGRGCWFRGTRAP